MTQNSGTIKIDNKNLLDDLLYDNRNVDYDLNDNINLNLLSTNNVNDVRKTYLETPTFAKDEEDMYRYVQSRLSATDYQEKSKVIMDSLNYDLDNLNLDVNNRGARANNNNTLNENFNNNNNNNNNSQQYLRNNFNIGLNNDSDNITNNNNNNIINRTTLMSDLAIATLPKRDSIQHLAKPLKANLNDNLFDQELLDSLDTANQNYTQNFSINNNNNNNNPYQIDNINQQQQKYLPKQRSFQEQQQEEFYLPRQNSNYLQQQQVIRLQQQQQQQQQQPQFNQQVQQNYLSQPQPFQLLPIQPSPRFIPIAPPQTLIPVQPIQPNLIQYHQQQQQQQIPIEYYQAPPLPLPQHQYQQIQQQQQQQHQQQQHQHQQQFQPQQQFDPQQQQQQLQIQQNPNMYSLSYSEPLLNYGSYPGIGLAQTSYFQNGYLSQPYPEPANQFLSDIYQPPYNTALDPLTGPNHYNNLIQNQPIPLPRRTQQHQLVSQQSNRSFDSSVKQINSPVSFDGDAEDIDRRNGNFLTQDEVKRQQVWDKLQKANKDLKSKNINNNNNNNNNNLSRKPPLNKNTPRIPQPLKANNGADFIEKNVDAIRNKENLGHRYPLKSYENLQNKKKELHQNFRSRSDTIKKPPGHLDPLSNDNNNNESKIITLNLNDGTGKSQSADVNALKTISIPINSNVWKDNDRINLDINLRLVDFLNAQNANNNNDTQNQYLVNRSLDNFGNTDNTGVDPLDQHIKRFESKITRSLPGSTGSLNKLKPLPPLNNNNNNNNFNNGKFNGTRLQHEYDYEVQENEGYLANLFKTHQKPAIKTYTLKDYKNFQKDTGISSTKSTGKLGFDFDNEDYKDKLEKAQKKVDYAQRVKARNRRLIEQQNKRTPELDKSRNDQHSKTQRGKEYDKEVTDRAQFDDRKFKSNLNRTISTIPNEYEINDEDFDNLNVINKNDSLFQNQKINRYKEVKNKQQQQQQKIKRSSSLNNKIDENDYEEINNNKFENKKQNRVPVKIVSEQPEPKIIKNKSTTEQKPKLDLSKHGKPENNDTTIIRIRDPVTSKVRTINLKDSEIDELARRHEQEKIKVNNVMKKQDSESSSVIQRSPYKIQPQTEQQQQQQQQYQKEQVSTTLQTPTQNIKQSSTQPQQEIDRVEELINRHHKEKQNAQQIKTDSYREAENLNDQLNTNRSVNNNKLTSDSNDRYDDIEI